MQPKIVKTDDSEFKLLPITLDQADEIETTEPSDKEKRLLPGVLRLRRILACSLNNGMELSGEDAYDVAKLGKVPMPIYEPLLAAALEVNGLKATVEGETSAAAVTKSTN